MSKVEHGFICSKCQFGIINTFIMIRFLKKTDETNIILSNSIDNIKKLHSICTIYLDLRLQRDIKIKKWKKALCNLIHLLFLCITVFHYFKWMLCNMNIFK